MQALTLDDELSRTERVEKLSVEEPVAKPGIEALNITVLPGRSWFEVRRFCPNSCDPFPHGLSVGLRPEPKTMKSGAFFSQNVDLTEVGWTPVGPTEDRTAHLKSNVAFAQVPMDLHAVEVISGNVSHMHRRHINGCSYLVFALPGTSH